MELLSELPSFEGYTREQIKDMLCSRLYGDEVRRPDRVLFTETEAVENFAAGRAPYRKFNAEVTMDGKTFCFPLSYVCPLSDKKLPGVVYLSFGSEVPHKFQPSEEISDMGVAVVSFDYQSVTPDNNDFDCLAGKFLGIDRTKPTASGKIMIWSWAARIAADFLFTRSEIDTENIAVVGHSRLGKTALVTAAFDERFKFGYANNSGCCGAALSNGKTGELPSRIQSSFPFWFCPDFYRYANGEEIGFDQHFLMSLVAPRYAYVASGELDAWADPTAEKNCCRAASAAWERLGLNGFVEDKINTAVPACFHEGSIGYHIRKGMHYLGREDWQYFVKFMKSKI